mgnify:CR=1 FL=1
MSIEQVREYLAARGIADRILEFDVPCATVEQAAQALSCEHGRVAKTLSFRVGNRIILVVAAGDTRVSNAKFKAQFGRRPSMLTHEEAETLIGHAVGGVCPFAVNPGVEIYLDVALRRFATVFLACGSSNSLIELTISELEEIANINGWVDVCQLSY